MCAFLSFKACSCLCVEERTRSGPFHIRNGAIVYKSAHSEGVRCGVEVAFPVRWFELSVWCIIRAGYFLCSTYMGCVLLLIRQFPHGSKWWHIAYHRIGRSSPFGGHFHCHRRIAMCYFPRSGRKQISLRSVTVVFTSLHSYNCII